ncbi:MAG TPA: amidohydrolase [Syntrophales bacterium]|nr:amidohydrolase [Syntrophales bacterium]
MPALDLLIRGGTALTLTDDRPRIHPAMIGIRDGLITLLEEGFATESRSDLSAAETLDASGTIILPGLVNTHTHLPMTLFRGLADDLPLMDWLNHHIFPAEARHIHPDTVYAGSLLALAEMILSGTTTFCDGYFYEEHVAQAALDTRMRGIVAEGFLDPPLPEAPDTAAQVRRAERFLAKWQGASPLVTPALFLHSPYTCSPATLTAIKDVARHHGALCCIHVAETREETAIVRDRYGTTPVRHLHRLGVLDEKTLAVHVNWVDEEEMTILLDCGVAVSHCPESSMKLSAGIAPVPALLNRGIPVGLGTDGCASNNDLDLFGEMDTAAKLHKVRLEDPTVMDAQTVLRMATRGGARCLGLNDRIGTLSLGSAADLIIVELKNKPHLTPLYNPWSQLVYAASGSDVATVVINGRIVLQDRRLVTIDLPAVIEDVERIADRIRSS